MSDATFADGSERALRLKAETAEDLLVLSSLLQDSILDAEDISWRPKQRRFSLLLNRFRWEDRDAAKTQKRPFERVRTLLHADSVLKVASRGIRPGEKDVVLSLLSVTFEPSDDLGGKVLLTFAGDGEIVLDVECLDVNLRDVSKPYLAVSGKEPDHRL